MDENDKFIFIESQKKKRVLLMNGYRYNLNVTNKGGSTLWRCFKRNECSASITINKDENRVIRKLKDHTCEANFNKNRTDAVMDKCKKLVCQKAKPVQKIFEKEFGRMDEIEQIPDFTSKKDTLFRARRKYLNVSRTEFHNLNDVEVPEILADDFLVCQDGCENNKILIFSTSVSRQCIKTLKNKMYFIDATFKAAPKPFYELLTILVDLNSCDEMTSVMGVIYALLPNKKQETYERLFDLIKQHFDIDMAAVKCDYEMALINGIKKAFPNTQITGCYYHLNKAVWKKASELGLTENKECRKIVRVCSNLPLLPSTYISECWTSIVENATEGEEMAAFLHYYEKQWLQSLADIISCPSHYNFRTNNALEGWHRRLNTNIKSKPTLLLFLNILRKEACWQDRKFKNILFEGNKRKKIDILFNSKYKRELQKLEGKKVNPFEFLVNLAHIKRIIKS